MRNVFSTSILVLAVLGCAKEEYLAQVEPTGEVQRVTVLGPAPIQFEAITGSPETKGTSIQDGSALLFNWEMGDTLGIFPNKGNQVEFPISASEGSTSASFDGGGWALRNNASYAAYYPFSVWNYHRDNETIVLDYSGQEQDGNGSFAHLSKYDFLASNKTTPQNSAVTFQMERQGSILYIDIVVPEPETIKSLTISCDEAIFVEKAALNISGAEPAVTPLKTTESLTLSFKNTATTTNNETVRAYMAVQPVDFTQKTVTATLTTESGSYTAPVTSRVVNKGRAAFLRFSGDFTPVNIVFADAEVKRICVENWDTNGDGELSYKEAAAVTDLGTVFRVNPSEHPSTDTYIDSFNELQYFTGLSEVGEHAFENCIGLVSIKLPNTVKTIGRYAFWGSAIEEIVLPEALESIGDRAFEFCDNLSHIEIPQAVNHIGEGAFQFCRFLEQFSGKYASSDGRSLIADGKLISFAPYGLTFYVIPGGVSRINNYVFNGCHDLSSITIPEGVTYIGTGAFSGCNLTSITIPESVVNIGTYVFDGCSNLEAFNGKFASSDGRCLVADGKLLAFAPYGLETYSIPESVSSIESSVFDSCELLTTVYIPNTVTNIGSDAFNSCTHLTSVNIPDSITSIGRTAFYQCIALTSIVIPENVSFIGSQAFLDCYGLEEVKCFALIPPENCYEAFKVSDAMVSLGFNNNCPIYVPNESVDAYKAAEGWSEYADRIVGMDVEGTVVGPEPQNPD